MRMFWWIMPSNHHIPAIKWLQEYGVSVCMGDKLPATELQVKRRGSMVLISSTITSVRIFIPCGMKILLYQDKNCQFSLFCMPICSVNHSLTVKNHSVEHSGVLSRWANLWVVYIGVWNGEQISVLLPLCSKQWLFHYSC